MAEGVQEDKLNNILYVEGLSSVTRSEELNEIFQVFEGFVEVRHFKHKKVAFVEYSTVQEAAFAMQQRNNLTITELNGE